MQRQQFQESDISSKIMLCTSHGTREGIKQMAIDRHIQPEFSGDLRLQLTFDLFDLTCNLFNFESV